MVVQQTVLWNTVATECQGDGDLLNNLRLKNVLTGEEKDLAVSGLFYAIGMRKCATYMTLILTPHPNRPRARNFSCSVATSD